MVIDVDVVELFVVRRLLSLVSSSRSAALIESLRFSIVDVGSCHASFVFSSGLDQNKNGHQQSTSNKS